MKQHIERFAPSPTGLLHLGHAYSALVAYENAMRAGGRFLLRIENIDQARCKEEYEKAIYDDLTWIGVTWERPVLKQIDRFKAYQAALDKLQRLGLLYGCNCSRKDIKQALSAPQEGIDGIIYPGTCKHENVTGKNIVLRLDMDKAIDHLGGIDKLSFHDDIKGQHFLNEEMMIEKCGDIALARKEFPTSYHLSVVVDDAFQDITHVTRGEDLFEATYIHRLLQALLELPTPAYYHHMLIRDAAGKRLAKRDDARAISKYRSDGVTIGELKQMIGMP